MVRGRSLSRFIAVRLAVQFGATMLVDESCQMRTLVSAFVVAHRKKVVVVKLGK